ncbi:kinetochore protein NDC80 homolog isoform X2 [Dreissena polymorpha]|uniref:kinetochore protein NDC80 homolog isoform X2 n=1 Tax=Dreissena polymorpha TaxID=45954 RepID=UPI00226507B8|nr:kinetochore protein NDC80 homolog isoform X2 [Dreissena polymorpha]
MSKILNIGIMRRASSSERMSLGPLRVKNDDNGRARSRPSVGSRSSFGGRPSISGTGKRSGLPMPCFAQKKNRLSSSTPRKSNIGLRNASGPLKDPRPISDRAFQQKCIRTVMDFLTGNHFQNNITPKVLQSPTSKDFYKLFEFVVGFIIPKYKVPQKPEEEIPRLLKQLGYPFLISKTSMFAIGSPHTWPSLLAALVYLIDNINIIMNLSEFSMESMLFPSDDFETKSESLVLFQFVSKSYTSYMNERDEYEEEIADLRLALRETILGSTGIDGLVEENRHLEEQLALLEQDSDRLEGSKQKLSLMQLDEERIRGYVSELDAHRREQELQLTEADEQCQRLEAELQAEELEIERMKEIERKQEFSQEDVERIHLKGRELRRQKEELERSIQRMNEDIWKTEISLSKELEECESKCQQYNKIAQALKLIPITAEHSCGIDYEMKKPMYSDVNDFHFTVKPALMTLKAQCFQSANEKESERMKANEQLEQVTEHLSDAQNELTLLESKFKRAEDEVETKRQFNQKQLETLQQKCEDLQTDIVQLNDHSTLTLGGLDNEIKRLRHWEEQEKQKAKNHLDQYVTFHSDALKEFMDNAEFMQNQLTAADEASQRELERVEAIARAAGIDLSTI